MMMNTITILIFLFCLVAAASAARARMPSNNNHKQTTTTKPRQQSRSRPNIVIFLADDMGYGDLSVHGNPVIETPNVDSLFHEGMEFKTAYAPASVCTPSRAGLLTGRLPVRSGMSGVDGSEFTVLTCNAEKGLPHSEQTLAELLRDQGYTTGMVGKWHLGQREEYQPLKHGFTEYYGLPYSVDMGCPLLPDHQSCTDEALLMLKCPPLPLLNQTDIIEQPVDLSTLAPKYAEWTKDFFKRHEEDENPTLLYVPFNHVHVSVEESRQYASKQFWNASAGGHFGDAVMEMDWLLGEIMSQVKNSQHANNTLVFFTSDNGPWLPFEENAGSVGPFLGKYAYEAFGYTDTGKGTTWEGGIRMPFAVWGLGHCSHGCSTIQPVSNMDIFSTVLDFAKVPVPTDRVIDGLSLREMLHEGANAVSPHEYLFHYRIQNLTAVTYYPYKVHFYTQSGYGPDAPRHHDPPLIFNIMRDPAEMDPLSPETTEFAQVYDAVMKGVEQHNGNMTLGANNLAHNSVKYELCCDKRKDCDCSSSASFTVHA